MEEKKEGGAAASAAAVAPIAGARKREDKFRRKDPRSWENVLKEVAKLDEFTKFGIIEKKYQTVYNDMRSINVSYQALEKQYTALQKLSDHNQSEVTKATLARSRLENLCRELQKQNKEIKDENFAKMKEEEERRKVVSQKFSTKLNEISKKMVESKEKSDELHEENQRMTEKLTSLYHQFQVRENEIAKMATQMELERQFADAKLAQMAAEKAMYIKKHDIMQLNLEKSEASCNSLLDTVKGLQENLNKYKGQYVEFETTMTKSNAAFDRFKNEMSSMNKQVVSREKEAQTWKSKWQESAATIIDLTEAKRNQDLVIQANDRRVDQLQKLCRQLQVDRAAYLKLLKSNGIEAPTQNVEEKSEGAVKKIPPAPVVLSKKEKELKLLKSSLRAAKDELSRAMFEESRPAEREQPVKLDEERIFTNSASSVTLPDFFTASSCMEQAACPEPVPVTKNPKGKTAGVVDTVDAAATNLVPEKVEAEVEAIIKVVDSLDVVPAQDTNGQDSQEKDK